MASDPRPLPGQEPEAPELWPSSDTGWRFAIAVGAALILVCLGLTLIGGFL